MRLLMISFFAVPSMMMQTCSGTGTVDMYPMVQIDAPLWECRIQSSKPPGMGVCGGSMKPQSLDYFAETQANNEVDACTILNTLARGRGEEMPICSDCVRVDSLPPPKPMPGCDPLCDPGDLSCCTPDCDPLCGC